MAISALIDKQDNFEIVRDKIASILAVETASQQALATAASEDPALWKLRVFTERSNPYAEFLSATDPSMDESPLVNVALDNMSVDLGSSNTVERQKYTATYHVDCFGFGVSTADGSGHIPGDLAAAQNAHRAARLVRNILMASEYTYLGLARGTIWRRMVQGIQMFEVRIDERAVQQVVAARINLQVEFSEFSPQQAYETLETIRLTVKRMENGEVVAPEQVLANADFDHS